MVSSREQRITDNLSLVHMVVNRFRARDADYDDLFQAGCVGLIKAADRFDESRGYQFSTYAVPLIMGEIRQLFRSDRPVKLSRSLTDKVNAVQKAREQYVRKEQREPTLSELSQLTGLPQDELCEALNAASPVVSLTADNDAEDIRDIPVNDEEHLMNRLLIYDLSRHLTAREQTVIVCRFYQGKTQCETGKVLGISQVQVSRTEKAALLKLREYLKE